MDPTKNPNIIEIKNDPTVVRGTRVTLMEGLRPARIVLRHLEDEGKYVTHAEYMRVDVETRKNDAYTYDYVVLSHEGFDHGHYFEYDRPGRPAFHNRTKEEAWLQAEADFYARER